jgi:hypothetical protein
VTNFWHAQTLWCLWDWKIHFLYWLQTDKKSQLITHTHTHSPSHSYCYLALTGYAVLN